MKVSCDVGYDESDGPRSFTLNERVHPIARVLDRWPGLDHRYYKVEDSAGDVYVLRQDFDSLAWECVMYDSTNRCAT